ncbi:Vacuolar protease A [Linnemannia zychae]|nr:Vacuolar protease A [Linnemannia zychae]
MKSTALFSSLLTLTAILSSVAQAKLIRLKLEPSYHKPAVNTFKSLNFLTTSHSAQVHLSEHQEGSHNIPLREYLGLTALINLGTPLQEFRVVIDLTDSNFWVTSSECVQPTCYLTRTYNASKSSTHRNEDKRLFSIPYVTQGIVSQDTLHIGDVQIPRQEFGEAMSFSIVSPGVFGFDGTLGLAYDESKPGASVTGKVSPIRNLYSNPQVDEPVFGLYMSPRRPNAPQGELTIGGLERRRFQGRLNWHNTLYPGQWIIPLKSASFASGNHVNTKRDVIYFDDINALLNTFSYGILFPEEIAQEINERLGFKANKDGLFIRLCEDILELEDVVITIGDKEYWFTSEEYLGRSNQDGTCYTAFQTLKGERDGYNAILGNIFLRKYYTAFDFGRHRVGFALAN